MAIYNYYAGPATLPREVLLAARDELLDFAGTGMSVLEISHRSKPFDAVVLEAEENLRKLMGLSDEYAVLFLQGGASLQFSMTAMNFLKPGAVGNYIVTGSFASKAYKEGKKLGETHVCFDDSENKFRHIPTQDELTFSEQGAYVHMTMNNTIYGTEFHYIPETKGIPLIADMSSDILSRPLDASRFDLIYAGAQKNLGPSGVTIVFVKKDFLATALDVPQPMLRYDTYADNHSMYNTPPCFSIYLVNLVARWLLGQGGMEPVGVANAKKAALVYETIDKYPDFFRGHADRASRSRMNVTFTLPSAELEKKFCDESTATGLIGLKGHRSVGGLRASLYNAMPMEGAQALAQFMEEFVKQNG